ncbi:MAG: hypothetical protein Q7S37_05240 [bacterium]|nr:hypothetical protein [bacterium]
MEETISSTSPASSADNTLSRLTGPSANATPSAGGSNRPFPPELNRWNWGAFSLTWIWSIGNRVWIGLFALIGPLSLAITVILGIIGINGSVQAWSIAYQICVILLTLIGPMTLVVAIILGIKGNEWAWKNRKFENVEQFKAVQQSWTKWGVVVFILSIIIVVGLVILGTYWLQTLYQQSLPPELPAAQ